MIDEANQEVLKIKFEYEELKRKLHSYKSKVESLLLSQLEILKPIVEEEEAE